LAAELLRRDGGRLASARDFVQIHGVAEGEPPAIVRLFDPSQLDDESGSRARTAVTVSDLALRTGCELVLIAPVRLECGRCDGGGCDACGRTGVVRAPADEAIRTVRLRVASANGDAVRVRIPRPFGDASEIRQLLVDVIGGVETSRNVRAIEKTRPVTRRRRMIPAVVAAAIAIASVMALAAAWLAR
jgi:hypothetical protein